MQATLSHHEANDDSATRRVGKECITTFITPIIEFAACRVTAAAILIMPHLPLSPHWVPLWVKLAEREWRHFLSLTTATSGRTEGQTDVRTYGEIIGPLMVVARRAFAHCNGETHLMPGWERARKGKELGQEGLSAVPGKGTESNQVW